MQRDAGNGRGLDGTEAEEPLPIVVCVGGYLPPSETFVYDQLKQARRTRPWVLARHRTEHDCRFPFDDVVVLGAPEWWAYYYAGLSPTVSRELAQRRPKLIHAHFGINAVHVLPFAKRLGIPLVVTFHGHDVGGLEPQNRWSLRYHRYQSQAHQLFEYSSVLLCASRELRDALEKLGAPPEKLRVHYLGVDTQYFRCEEPRDFSGQQNVLMVGRLVEKKGMKHGILAFAHVVQRFAQAKLRIVGSGPLENELRAFAKQLGLDSVVSFLGTLDEEGVRREMARAQVLLTPSVTTRAGDRESGVIVIKEAGAMGLPTVASRHGGIPEIIEHGENGFLVDERNDLGLADRLFDVLGSPELAQRMSRRARELIEKNYDTHVQNAVLESILVKVATHRYSLGIE